MLQLTNVSKAFGKLQAVDRLSISFSSNEVVGLLGPNGAGKSTTMRMVSGFMMPDDGQITLCGYDVIKQRQIAQSVLGYLPEAPNGFGHLKVIEFLHFCGQARGFFGEKLLHAVDRVSQRLDLF